MKILPITVIFVNIGTIEPVIKLYDDIRETIKDYFDFKHYLILTDKDVKHDRYEIKYLQEMTLKERDFFFIRDVWKHIKTSHFLLVHLDSHIINPEAWDDNWMSYDCIAAPWADGFVGCGGFSLRSVKLAHHVSQKYGNLTTLNYHEDGYYSNLLNKEPILNYPTKEEALKFSQETVYDPNVMPFSIHDAKIPDQYDTYNYWLNIIKNK